MVDNERVQDKLKVSQAFKTLKGKELSQAINAYFRKYLKPTADKSLPIGGIFDGKVESEVGS